MRGPILAGRSKDVAAANKPTRVGNFSAGIHDNGTASARRRPGASHVAQGVRGYDRAALEADYRLSALWQLMTPVWQASIDLPPVIWWSHLERITLAVDDLGGRDLLA